MNKEARRNAPLAILALSLTVLMPCTSWASESNTVHAKIVRTSVKINTAGEPGSGVIVKREGNRYYVLTAAHVALCASQKQEEQEVITSNGKSHFVRPEDISCPQLMPPMAHDAKQCDNEKNKSDPWAIDLAVISFWSDERYDAATRTSVINRPGISILVAGYPINSSRLKVVKSEGGALVPPSSLSSTCQGYGLRYIAPTEKGMSGGGVWNKNGELVGIHGYRIMNKSDGLALARGSYSSGIPISYWKAMDDPLKVSFLNETLRKSSRSGGKATDYINKAQNIINRGLRDESLNELSLQEAASLIERARSMDKSQPAYPAMQAQMYVAYYKKFGGASDPELLERALALVNIAIRQSRAWRKSYEGLYEPIRAEVHALRGNYQKAVIDIDTRLSFRPDDTAALKDKAKYLFELGNLEGAYQAINRAVSIAPNDPAALIDRSLILAKAGMNHIACADLKRAVRIASLLAEKENSAIGEDGTNEESRASQSMAILQCR
jgi:tetratricopeptide (TPR) repeat protein